MAQPDISLEIGQGYGIVDPSSYPPVTQESLQLVPLLGPHYIEVEDVLTTRGKFWRGEDEQQTISRRI